MKKNSNFAEKMRHLLIVFFVVVFCFIDSNAQIIVNPVFDRSDYPAFRVEKVEMTQDTTYIYCSLHANNHSWACLSGKTYLENVQDGTRYPILKVSGIPFSPEHSFFSEADEIQVVLFFPHICAEKINIIENDDDGSFNIYGVDLNESYKCSYTDDDIDVFFNAAMDFEKKKDWQSAIDCLLKQLEASKYVYGIRSKETSWPMYSLTMQYAGLREYEKMIEWGCQAIDILTVLPQDSINLDVLARAYGNVGTAYRMLKQPEAASRYLEMSLEIRKIKDGLGICSYEEYLRDMAVRCYYDGDYPKALLYGKEIASIYENKYKENRNKYGCVYVNSLCNLCEYYKMMHQFDEAYEIGMLALKLIEESVCSEYKFDVYQILGSLLASVGKYDEAIKYFEAILDVSDSFSNNMEWSTQTRLIVTTKTQLAGILFECKQDTIKATKEYEEVLQYLEKEYALGNPHYYEHIGVLMGLWHFEKNRSVRTMYLEKAIQLQKEWHGESVEYAQMLFFYVYDSFINSTNDFDTDIMLGYVQKLSDIIKRHIKKAIFILPKRERDDYWGRFALLYTWIIPTISHRLNKDEWSSLAYDAALFYKGMLLSSDMEFKKVISLSNDSTLQQLYSSYVQDLSRLECVISSPHFESEIDSLEIVIREKESILSRKMLSFTKQHKGTSYSWKEVRDKLGDNDVAIEFVSYVSPNESTFSYDAYVITNKSKAPKLIPLFDDMEFRGKEFSYDDYCEMLSGFIWGNDSLSSILQKKENIYFSTCGFLNVYGIEYLSLGQNVFVNEKYNLFRVSSTSEICMTKDITIQKVCLYGGLDYNVIPSPTNERTATNNKSGSFREALLSRGDFEPLNGSKKEVEQIENEIASKNVSCGQNVFCVVRVGAQGTEESFKKISGSDINLIHISTHGMYVPEDDEGLRETNNYRFIVPSESSFIDEENKSLSRSFLVMSGGNTLIRRDSIPSEMEDGILTALEISRLDFTNLDLVVLSACETALGDNVFWEGVYGLQRGFKKAGANTILMSLNKVDDEATRILMVEFYRNLMNGKTKRQSFQEAQQYLRKVDNGKYDSPKYWASFIMLDGLN